MCTYTCLQMMYACCVCLCLCVCAVLTLGAMRCSCLRVMRLYMVLMSFLWSSYSDTVIWRGRRFHSSLHTHTRLHEHPHMHISAQSAHIGQLGLQLYYLPGLLRGVVSSQHAQQALHQGLVRRKDLGKQSDIDAKRQEALPRHHQ